MMTMERGYVLASNNNSLGCGEMESEKQILRLCPGEGGLRFRYCIFTFKAMKLDSNSAAPFFDPLK